MKTKVLCILAMFMLPTLYISAKEYSQDSINIMFSTIENHLRNVDSKMENMSSHIQSQSIQIDSLNDEIEALKSLLLRTDNQFNEKTNKLDANVTAVNNRVDTTEEMFTTKVNKQMFWGVAIVIVFIIVTSIVLAIVHKRIKTGSINIDEIKSSQETLQKAQIALQEESIKLDNRFAELLEKQLAISQDANSKSSSVEIDHSLVLKVADEVVRMEMNLLKMDSSVKGHKQLTKAVERIKNNFLANGYEFVDMLGKPYDGNMKVVANFITDENLKDGEQIISSIIKPQINYKGVMIQAAQITVSISE